MKSREERQGRGDRGDRSRRGDRSERGNRKERRSNSNFTRFHINLGSKNRVSAVDLISLINENTGNKSIEIGKIEILKTFSFFELDKAYEKKVVNAFKDVTRDGIQVKLEVSKNKEKPDVPKRFKKKRERDGKRKFRG
jgi:ATP-dependent RNA helicase DeaD